MSDKPTFSKFVQNHNLFQDYYLLHYVEPTLPLTPEEAQNDELLRAARADAADAQNNITALWQARKKQLPVSEANVEDFVAEVCRILGMVPSSQGSVPRDGTTTQRVDLVLFADNDAANRFAEHTKQQKPASERYAEALAVVEVERVRKNFNPKRSSRDSPQQQIVNYLTFTGVPWGILTDGERWRIYRRFDPPRFGAWLEINLSEILFRTDPVVLQEAFWCFVGFFHRDAFDRHQRTARLDAFYDGSVQYAIGVQDSLRDQAFKVVEQLAQGMYATHPSPNTANLETLYEQATVILYRMLFLKFAEDRQILPIRYPVYRLDYGYAPIEQELLNRLDTPDYPLGTSHKSARFWNRLMYIFNDVHEGNPEAKIFAYNGGLFRPDRLDDVIIPDVFLAQALDYLSRITQNEEKLHISYRDLEIRHLGSIYEGLLEQHLERVNGTVQMVSSSGQPTNQRRSSGSYYTPDYIVDYIVQQTIDPLCEGKTAEEIAHLTILDPSMGSGHFLVTALTRLAWHHAMAHNRATTPAPERVSTETDAVFAERLNAYHAHITPTDEEVAQSQYELVERCIYGVDLNPLAVELAKLALWLSTLTYERPLSFLDHHLTTGNSLIGTRLDDLKHINGHGNTHHPNGSVRQQGLFEQVFERVHDQLLASFRHIAAMPTRTAQDVYQKEQEYATFRDFSKPFRMVANLWVSQHFGNTFNGDQYQEVFQALDRYYSDPPDTTQWGVLQQQPWFVYAEEQATKRHFFHWDLEFPEVFLRTQSGFDVVIGNPPYLLMQNAIGMKADFEYAKQVYSVAQYKIDTYALFIEKAISLLTTRGKAGVINPNTFLKNKFSSQLRAFILENTRIKSIVLIPLQVFPDASVDTCILIVERGSNDNTSFRVINLEHGNSIGTAQSWLANQESFIANTDFIFDLSETKLVSLSAKVTQHSCFLSQMADAYFGIQTKDRKTYVSTVAPDSNWKRTLDGGNVSRYNLQAANEYVLFQAQAIKSGGDATIYEQPKIVVRQIGEKPIASFDPDYHYPLNTIYNITLTDKTVNVLYILSCINSLLLGYYWKLMFFDHKATFPKVKKAFLLSLPIRRIHFTTPQDERTQRARDLIVQAEDMTKPDAPLQSVRDVAAFRASNLGQALLALLPMDEQGQFLAFKDGATGNEEHSDVVHDLLAHLAQRMLDLNRERRQHITNLLTDLEGVMHTSDWNNLGKTRQLWNPTTKKAQAARDAMTVLGDLHDETLSIDDDIGRISRSQFPWLLKHKLGRVAHLADLLKIYDQYHAQIATLEHQRDATDYLIDQIVYLLYGLTPDEITLIETA